MDNEHDNGTCYHAAGDPCPAEGTYQRQGYICALRGLARLDAAGLSDLRAIILTVIDDGRDGQAIKPWVFHSFDADADNAQRLDFCDAIAQAIIRQAAPAAAPATTAAHDPDHLNPAKGGNRAGDDYW